VYWPQSRYGSGGEEKYPCLSRVPNPVSPACSLLIILTELPRLYFQSTVCTVTDVCLENLFINSKSYSHSQFTDVNVCRVPSYSRFPFDVTSFLNADASLMNPEVGFEVVTIGQIRNSTATHSTCQYHPHIAYFADISQGM
jgi:hypothetical protein